MPEPDIQLELARLSLEVYLKSKELEDNVNSNNQRKHLEAPPPAPKAPLALRLLRQPWPSHRRFWHRSVAPGKPQTQPPQPPQTMQHDRQWAGTES